MSKQTQEVSHVKALAKSVESSLAALGTPIAHRNALKVVANLAGHPSYQALLAMRAQAQPSAEDVEISLSRYAPNGRMLIGTMPVRLSLDALRDLVDHAVHVALLRDLSAENDYEQDELLDAARAYGLIDKLYTPPGKGSLSTTKAKQALLEELEYEFLEDREQPGLWYYQRGWEESDISYPSEAQAVIAAWEDLVWRVCDAPGMDEGAWSAMDDAAKRLAIIEYFED